MNRRKRKCKKKRILQAGTILSAALAFYICGTAATHAANNLSAQAKKQEGRFYPSEEEALQLFDAVPLVCTPVQQTYQSGEGRRGFSEAMLADLQEYVRRGELAEAMEAYRDETLLIEEEELRLLCPDYENLLAEWMEEEQNITVNAEDVRDNIVQIYKLQQSGKEEALLLLEYGGIERPWYYIEKKGEAYRAGSVRLEGYGNTDWQSCERIVFADEDGYCLLIRVSVWRTYAEEEELLRLCRFTLQEEEKKSPFSPFTMGETRYIRARITKVSPEYFYLNGSSALTPVVQEYVTENAAVFADRMAENETIWGDEEYAEPPKTAVEILWTESGERDAFGGRWDWRWTTYVSTADYDNDGSEELFWRSCGRRENVLLVEEDGGYRTEYIRLFRQDIPAEQMWFVEFEGKIVTFEIAEPYGADYPILSAYLIEENKKTPILTCQLVYGKTVEIDEDSFGEFAGDRFGIKFVEPLIADLEEASEAQAAFRKELTAWIRGIGEDVTIVPADTLSVDGAPTENKIPLPENFLNFIREGAAWSLSGRHFSAYVSPYEVDTEEDLAEFTEKYEAQLSHSGYWYDMAYNWGSPDGTDNYLVNEFYDFESGVSTLYWYRDDGEGLYQREAITDLSMYGSYCGILSYGGRRYCVIAERDTWISPMRIDLIVLGDVGEWEHYCISLTYESEKYDTYALYAADVPETLIDYVAEESEEILTCLHEWTEVFEGRGTYGELPNEAWRNIKNRDLSYAVYAVPSPYGHNRYREVDADNDGEPEYAASYYAYGNRGFSFFSYSLYGWRNGSFVELSLTGKGLLDSYEDEDGVYGVLGSLKQLWFEEFDGVTYLFTVEELSLPDSYLLRVRVIRDGEVQDVGAWLFRHSGAVLEDIQKMEEYDSWMAA